MTTGTGSTGTGGTGRRTGAAARAAAAGAAARTTPATGVGPTTPPAGRWTRRTTTTQPHRNYLGIALAVLGALVVLGVLAYLMRPEVNVNVNNGGSKVTVNIPVPGPDSGPAHSSTEPSAPASASPSRTSSPTPSATYPENMYSHWISPADVTTACHEQASSKSTAVFQLALYYAGRPVPKDWYCQDVQNLSYQPWYSANSSQPLGPIISYSIDLNLYCQYTYGQAGDGQWLAEDGPNNEYYNSPPASGSSNPFPKEMCYKVPNSGS